MRFISLTQTAAGESWLPRIGNAVADLLFPPHCVACHSLGEWLCVGCASAIEAIHQPVCSVCGWPLPAGGRVAAGPAAACGRCAAGLKATGGVKATRTPSSLAGVRAYGFHAGPLREAIHALKYEGLRSLAPVLGRLMARSWPELAPGCPVDVLVPVPLHAARQRERGYNQSALLARELAREIGQPVSEGLLVRVKSTVPQVGLTAEQRRANVAAAFRCVSSGPSGRHILLVDDVCTTGATLEAAAAALLQAGATSVWAYTLAHAR